MTDVTNPGWRETLNRGGILNNPMTLKRTSVYPPKPAYYKHHYKKDNWRYCSTHKVYHAMLHETDGMLAPTEPENLEIPLGDLLSVRQTLIDKAVTQAHANVDVSQMQALVSTAEARKTVESMGNILKRATRVLRAVRKLDIRKLRKEISPHELADRYMEARYAIRPVIYDAIQVRNYAATEHKRIRETFRGESAERYVTQDTIRQPLIWLVDATWARETGIELTARAGVLCDADITALSASGSDQFAETLWELTPFSFIADWFANTGDVIASWTPNVGVNELASWVTIKSRWWTESKIQQLHSTAGTIGYYSTVLELDSVSYQKEELVLERIVGPPLAVIPRLDINLDGWKLTDLTLILRGIFRN